MSNTCKRCGADRLVSLSSINKRICPDCKAYHKWELDPGEPSVLIEGLKGGKKNV